MEVSLEQVLAEAWLEEFLQELPAEVEEDEETMQVAQEVEVEL